jgi:hypothetical protein
MSFSAAHPPRVRKIDLPLVGLGVALLAGAALRFYGIDWDGGHLFHPDERHILMVTQDISLPWPPDWRQLADPASPLNPRSFAYGSFVFYFLKLFAHLLSGLGGAVDGLAPLREASAFEGLRFVGRFVSASFDLGTVVIIFFLGRRLYGAMAGLLAAAFVAFSVLHIQLAHFYASDTLLTLFIVLVVYLSVRLVDQRSSRGSGLGPLAPGPWPLIPAWPLALALGVALGLALATKVSGLPVALAIVTACGLRLFVVQSADVVQSTDNEGAACGIGLRRPNSLELSGAVASLLITAAVAVVVFLIAEPYALIDFKTFWANLGEQNEMVRGIADFPYTRQYADRAPYLYFLDNLVVWGVGLPLGLAMVAGLIWAVARSFLRLRPAEVVVLAWVVPYFLITGSFHTMFLRYLLPITPFLSLFAAGMIWSAARWLRRRAEDRSASTANRPSVIGRALAGVLVAVVLLPTLFYAVAYANVYSTEHTGVAASRWIYDNIPDGAHVAREHWEEGLPVSVPLPDGVNQPEYVINTLNMYDEDGPEKIDHLIQQLRDSDYIVFYSQRMYGTLPRLPARYPISTDYYRLLFSGQLGYQLDAFFTSYPRFLGVAFVDDTLSEPGLPVPAPLANFAPAPITLNLGRADESFTVYDHPKVLIFKKTRDLSPSELYTLLTSRVDQSTPTP